MRTPGALPEQPDADRTEAEPANRIVGATPPRPFPQAPSEIHMFDPPATAGEVGVLGPYQIVRELGRGGMGAVYLATDTRLQRKLALKVMLPRFAVQPAAKERFLREARAAAQISHDNVVTVYEADERRGVPYIAMQFLKGTSLDDYLKRKGNLAIGPILRVGREAVAGLAAAHKIGLVHRDIKPANLWLEAPNGRVKVLDFGLAKPLDSDIELTTSGMLLGTPVYMSPEQARGHAVDVRSDLFSLGGVLYRLCSGHLPFAGNTTMALLMALGTEDPKPLLMLNPEVPTALANLIHQMLEKKPEKRPQTADDVGKRLRAIAEQYANPNAPAVTSSSASAAPQLPDQAIHITAVASAPSGFQLSSAIVHKTLPKKALWAAGAAAVLIIGGIAFLVRDKDIQSSKTNLSNSIPPTILARQADASPTTEPIALTQPGTNAQPEIKPATEKTAPPTTRPQFASIPQPDAKSFAASIPQPETKPALAPKPSPPVEVAADPELNRSAAQWILSVGARLQANNVTEIFGQGDVPNGNFVVSRAFFFNTREANDDTITHLSGLTDLTTIMIDSPRVSDKGIASLKNLKSLTCLAANGTQVTGAALINFQDVKSLVSVNLNGCATDEGMDGVAACKSLKFLNLQSPKITNAGLAKLKTIPGLLRIDLKKSKVTPAGLADFHAAVPACKLEHDGGIIEPAAPVSSTVGRSAKLRDAVELLTSPDYVWTAPRSLANELNPTTSQGDPFVRSDGLELYYASGQGEPNGGDIWVSRRKSIDAPWTAAVNAGPQINTKSWDASPHLTADGLTLIFWRYPEFRVFQCTRASLQGPWSPAVELSNSARVYTPILSPDGLELFATLSGGKFQRTTRPIRKAGWQNAVAVDELNENRQVQARWISPDALTLLMQAGADGEPHNFYLAKRSTPGKAFQTNKTPLDLPGPPNQALHPFPFMTPGGLDLYFRLGGNLYVSRRVPKGSDTRSPDRRAAELVIALGGKFRPAGSQATLSRLSDFPKEDFLLSTVGLYANKSVTEGDMDELSKSAGITELFMYSTPTTDRSLLNLKNQRTLTLLDLGGTRVTDAGLDHIKGMPNLRSLLLHYTRVSTSWLKNLRSFPLLENLNLTGAVDDAGLANVARVPTLQTLIMEGTPITDAGLMQLQTLKRLRSIDVKNTKITSDAAQKLHAALPSCRIEYNGGTISATP